MKMKFQLSNVAIGSYNQTDKPKFPKYTSQLINWANQNAQGTRPRIVGKMSDLFPQFLQESTNPDIQEWGEWYNNAHPDAIENASRLIYTQIENLKTAIQLIDQSMVHEWVQDLVVNKTFNGMYVQKAILAEISRITNKPFKMATPEEESKGIDGFVGDVAYSIKPESYLVMKRLPESIPCKIAIYQKTKTGIHVEVLE